MTAGELLLSDITSVTSAQPPQSTTLRSGPLFSPCRGRGTGLQMGESDVARQHNKLLEKEKKFDVTEACLYTLK